MTIDECPVLPATGNTIGAVVAIALVALAGGIAFWRFGRPKAVLPLVVLAVALGAIAWSPPVQAAAECPIPTVATTVASPTTTSATTTTAASTTTTAAGVSPVPSVTVAPSSTVTPTPTSTASTSTTPAPTSTAATSTSSTTVASVGALRISKLVDDPVGGYIGGTSKVFTGTYDCGGGFSGVFSTLRTSAPVVITGLPAGSTCVVAEDTPTGGLLNASFAWAAPAVVPASVEVVADTTVDVVLTNTVIQQFGPLTIGVQVTGPGGYTGGSTRVFPASYSCTLTNGPTSTGTVSVSPASSGSTSPIPAGSTCVVTMTLTPQPGDFADTSYAWVGAVANPASAVILPSTGASVVVTATYAAA